MNWTLTIAAALSGVVIAHGLDIAFWHRDPPAGARIATRGSRRVAGLSLVALAIAHIILQFSNISE